MCRGGWVILLAALCLCGCASLTDMLAPPYVPVPIHVYDKDQFGKDLDECKLAGKDWVPTFSIGALATKTVDGATSNTSLIPISPLVPLYGGAGGAASAAADGLDVMSGQHANVFRNCLHAELLHDHAAVVADPRD